MTKDQSPIVIEKNTDNQTSMDRYYNPLDYWAAILWEMPPKKVGENPKYETQWVRRTEADKEGNPIRKKPHPAAKEICKLFKNDYIEFSENGIWRKARIAGLNASSNRLDIRPIYSTTDCADWITSTTEGMLEKGWKPQKGHNFVSVNVLFGEKSAKKITVNPIGRVFRKKP